MLTFKISDVHAIEPREAVYSLYLQREALPSQPGGFAAELTTDEGIYNLSKLDGEDAWVIDGKWTLRGLPLFFNGEGSRCTLLHKLADEAIIDALDEAVAMQLAGHDGTRVG